MIPALCLCFACGFGAPDAGQVSKRNAAEEWKIVEAALESSPDLLENHRGFLAAVKQNQALARALDTWLDLNLLAEFHALARAADEALYAAPAAERLFDQYYDQIARDPELRKNVEALQRTELDHARKADYAEQPLSNGLDYLRANPDTAVPQLRQPTQGKTFPRELRPFLDAFNSRPDLLQEFLNTFQGITANPLAQSRILPWWQTAPGFDANTGGAFNRFHKHLLAHPSRYWAWHEWNLTLAAEVRLRTWVRYWFRKERRVPDLDERYDRYLDLLRKQPDYAVRAESRWSRQSGPAPVWPPGTDPPVLPKWTPPERAVGQGQPHPRYTMPEKPGRPEVRRPDRPKMPDMPTMTAPHSNESSRAPAK